MSDPENPEKAQPTSSEEQRKQLSDIWKQDQDQENDDDDDGPHEVQTLKSGGKGFILTSETVKLQDNFDQRSTHFHWHDHEDSDDDEYDDIDEQNIQPTYQQDWKSRPHEKKSTGDKRTNTLRYLAFGKVKLGKNLRKRLENRGIKPKFLHDLETEFNQRINLETEGIKEPKSLKQISIEVKENENENTPTRTTKEKETEPLKLKKKKSSSGEDISQKAKRFGHLHRNFMTAEEFNECFNFKGYWAQHVVRALSDKRDSVSISKFVVFITIYCAKATSWKTLRQKAEFLTAVMQDNPKSKTISSQEILTFTEECIHHMKINVGDIIVTRLERRLLDNLRKFAEKIEQEEDVRSSISSLHPKLEAQMTPSRSSSKSKSKSKSSRSTYSSSGTGRDDERLLEVDDEEEDEDSKTPELSHSNRPKIHDKRQKSITPDLRELKVKKEYVTEFLLQDKDLISQMTIDTKWLKKYDHKIDPYSMPLCLFLEKLAFENKMSKEDSDTWTKILSANLFTTVYTLRAMPLDMFLALKLPARLFYVIHNTLGTMNILCEKKYPLKTIPPQPPMPGKCPKNCKELTDTLRLYKSTIVISLLIIAGTLYGILQATQLEVAKRIWVVYISRATAGCIITAATLLFFTVSYHSISYLHKFDLFRMFFNFVDHENWHKIYGWLLVVNGIVHSVAWHFTGLIFADRDRWTVEDYRAMLEDYDPDINKDEVWTVPEFLWQTLPGITGYVMFISAILIGITSIGKLRYKNFELWFNVHHLYIPFTIALFLHAQAGIFIVPVIHWFMLPGVLLFVIDKIFGIIQRRQILEVEKAENLSSKVTFLRFILPREIKTSSLAGGWAWICIPKFGKNEWHPFSITNACGVCKKCAKRHEAHLDFHIAKLKKDSWTDKLYQACEVAKENPQKAKDNLGDVYIEGPVGFMGSALRKYEYVLLIGAGIGVTPLASMLKTMRDVKTPKKKSLLQQVDFIWMTRDQESFDWFGDLLDFFQKSWDVFTYHLFLTSRNSFDIRSLGLGLLVDDAGNTDEFFDFDVRFGRPNWTKLFQDLYGNHSEKDKPIGVFYCGPGGRLLSAIEATCLRFSGERRRFEFHAEAFG